MAEKNYYDVPVVITVLAESPDAAERSVEKAIFACNLFGSYSVGHAEESVL